MAAGAPTAREVVSRTTRRDLALGAAPGRDRGRGLCLRPARTETGSDDTCTQRNSMVRTNQCYPMPMSGMIAPNECAPPIPSDEMETS